MTKIIKGLFVSIALLFTVGCASENLSPKSNGANNYRGQHNPVSFTQSLDNFITIGSSKETVARIQGTPRSLHNYIYFEEWRYQDGSSIEFRNDKVSGWNNYGSLRISLHGAGLSSENRNQNNHLTKKSPVSPTYSPAENGSYYGQISPKTGRPKTTHVRGYHRKDGTYVRGHYRS